jgi:hypothetical protein
MKLLKIVIFALLIFFAGIGILFSGVFVAMQFGLLNVRGSIEARNNSILSTDTFTQPSAVSQGTSSVPDTTAPDYSCKTGETTCPWTETREWEVVSGGLVKDIAIIEQVATETGVPPRLIASVVIPEQIRFFTSNREVFKRYFEPLKILGSLSKFSLGVSGIKQETAEAVERYASDSNSPFYPGENYAELLAYNTDVTNQSDELFNRLTDEKNHYYSYLYTAIFIKEILTQWEKAGYDITDKPEIVATIFNIGFDGSNPKPNPQVAGTVITVGGSSYTFGELSGLFYQSDQLPALKQ